MYNTAYSNHMYTNSPLNYVQDFSWLEKTAKERNIKDQEAYLYVNDLKNKALNKIIFTLISSPRLKSPFTITGL